MTITRKRVLVAVAVAVAIFFTAVYIAARSLRGRLEPMVKDQAIRYLQDRFHADVQLADLRIHLPRLSTFGLVFHRQRGAVVQVDGEGLSLRRAGAEEPLFVIQKLHFTVDIASVLEDPKKVDSVSLVGVRITVPPKGDGAEPPNGADKRQHRRKSVVTSGRIQQVEISGCHAGRGCRRIRHGSRSTTISSMYC